MSLENVVKDSNPKDAVGIEKSYSTTVSRPVLHELGVAMLEGALKYGRHNYRAIGVRASVYIDATHRHIDSWWEGEDIDPDSQLSHITKAIASLVVLRDAMIMNKLADDRPPRAPAGWMATMNAAVKKLMTKYPPETRKAPFTQERMNEEARIAKMHAEEPEAFVSRRTMETPIHHGPAGRPPLADAGLDGSLGTKVLAETFRGLASEETLHELAGQGYDGTAHVPKTPLLHQTGE